ncbi:ATP synthase F0 subunit C [bacterium]|nr:ATP synthase F0 subunit C [bacterium]
MKKLLSILSLIVAQFGIVGLAMAEETAKAASSDSAGLIAIGAAISMGLGALGGALGQGKAASAALEGIARNPGAQSKVQTPMILGLALIESLVLLSFVIAFMLVGKL